jgi:hypothetical protein
VGICFVSESQIIQLPAVVVGQFVTAGNASVLVIGEVDIGRYGTFYAAEKQRHDIVTKFVFYKHTFPKIFPLDSSSVKFSI